MNTSWKGGVCCLWSFLCSQQLCCCCLLTTCRMMCTSNDNRPMLFKAITSSSSFVRLFKAIMSSSFFVEAKAELDAMALNSLTKKELDSIVLNSIPLSLSFSVVHAIIIHPRWALMAAGYAKDNHVNGARTHSKTRHTTYAVLTMLWLVAECITTNINLWPWTQNQVIDTEASLHSSAGLCVCTGVHSILLMV